jgi:HSP20 family protein
MTLMRFDPFRELDRLSQQMFTGTRALRTMTMPMEAFRRGDMVFVHLDLPGVDPNDVDLTVERNVVSVRAVRRSPRQEGDEVLVDERIHGEFARQLFLGDNLDTNKLQANFDKGVLIVQIPVAESSKPRRVQINAPSAEQPQTIEATQAQEAPAQGATTTSSANG